MVKNNAPLQIRLTEPVIFLRGPSTGADFRGRPQNARDGQAAMVRGLLTMRLSKPTRIRNISVTLEGKGRTEWPEGIGPRRTDTHEEHPIISETNTFFSASDPSNRTVPRRSRSLGPGTMSQYDLDSDDEDGHWVPDDDIDDMPERGRMVRSSSAVGHNMAEWPSRQNSPTREESLQHQDSSSAMAGLSINDRGPSPAYTPPLASHHPRPSGLRETILMPDLLPPRDHALSPIVSANVSANPSSRGTSANPSSRGSDRAESTDTEHRFRRGSSHLVEPPITEENFNPTTPPGEPHEAINFPDGDDSGAPSPSVHFSEPPSRADSLLNLQNAASAEDPNTIDLQATPMNRPSSLHTIDTRSSVSSQHHGSTSEYHPVMTGETILPTAPPSPLNESPLNESPAAESPINGSPFIPPTGSNSDSLQPPLSAQSSNPSPGVSAEPSPRGSIDPPRPGYVGGTHMASPHTSTSTEASSSAHTPTLLPRDSQGHSQTHTPFDEGRGRKVTHAHKFSLAAALRGLSQDVKERVRHSHSRPGSRTSSRPSSRRNSGNFATSDTPRSGHFSINDGSSLPMSRSSSATAPMRAAVGDFHAPQGRGGAGGRNKSKDRYASPAPEDNRGRSRKSRKAFDQLGKEDEEVHHNWKEFKKGTYNYPISFSIPANAPPSIHAEFGTVVYRLKASVVRAGALTSNLVEEMEITMIAGPQEDDMEETDNVIVERQWEDQMRYQIALSGKAFPIGGVIPMSVRLMPLTKCKIHRLTVALEEKTDYFAAGRKVARHETPRRFILFAAKNPESKKDNPHPLLPILSDAENAIETCPLAPLARQAALNNPREFSDFSNPEDDVYAQLLDPMGPWHLERDLAIPDCSSRIKFTTKHDQTNIAVAHWLKVTIRVERGDDEAVDSKGRRKQFDIIIETPIKILDCRVNPQYNSLPSYDRVADPNAPGQGCSIHSRNATTTKHGLVGTSAAVAHAAASTITHSALNFQALVHHSDREPGSGTHTPGTGANTPHEGRAPAHPHGSSHAHVEHDDTLLERNIVYDRLMSGQETETGEEPPSYGEAVANAIRSARSASRAASRTASRPASRAPSRSRVRTTELESRPSSRSASASRQGSRSQSRAHPFIED